MKEENEDRVTLEIPIFLNQTLLNQLYVFQYPTIPYTQFGAQNNVIQAKIKPISEQIELETALETSGPTFDEEKAEKIAHDVDGLSRNKNDEKSSYFSSKEMDKLILKSQKSETYANNSAVGVVDECGLHLTSVKSILSLKPSFGYLDVAEKHKKLDDKERLSEDEDDQARKVQVRFERPETDRSKLMKEKSFHFMQKKINEEPWIHVDFHKHESDRSKFDVRNLFCQNQQDNSHIFSINQSEYLSKLVSLTNNSDVSMTGATKTLSQNQLKS